MRSRASVLMKIFLPKAGRHAVKKHMNGFFHMSAAKLKTERQNWIRPCGMLRRIFRNHSACGATTLQNTMVQNGPA